MGVADGSIMAVIIIVHIRKTATKLIDSQLGDIGIVIIAIGLHISTTSHTSIDQHRNANRNTNANTGVWFLAISMFN